MSDARALSVSEVAERLGIRTHGVLTLIRTGELRAFDVSLTPGGKPRWRISADDLEAFILRRTHRAAAPRRKRRKPATELKRYF